MAMQLSPIVSRRNLMVAGGAAALPALAGCGRVGDAAPEPLDVDVLQQLCDLVIPRSGTPGAADPSVVRWIATAYDAGVADVTPETWGELMRDLEKAGGQPFGSLPASRRAAVLAKVDAALGPPGPPPVKRAAATTAAQHPPSAPPPPPTARSAWSKVKALILRGYYTSETGASKDLVYELVPGRYDPAVAVTPATRAYSTDSDARNMNA